MELAVAPVQQVAEVGGGCVRCGDGQTHVRQLYRGSCEEANFEWAVGVWTELAKSTAKIHRVRSVHAVWRRAAVPQKSAGARCIVPLRERFRVGGG